MAKAREDRQREIESLTLPEAWSIVARAWCDRRREPELWLLIANNVCSVRNWQAERVAARL